MKTNLKSANAKAKDLLNKLEALAERGIDGEKLAAQKKIARLKARFEVRNVWQRLPSRPGLKKVRKGKKHDVAHAPGLHIHPYTIALSLGKQIRFSAPLEQIAAELEAVTRKHLTES